MDLHSKGPRRRLWPEERVNPQLVGRLSGSLVTGGGKEIGNGGNGIDRARGRVASS